MRLLTFQKFSIVTEPANLTEMITTWLEFVFKNQMKAPAVKEKSVEKV